MTKKENVIYEDSIGRVSIKESQAIYPKLIFSGFNFNHMLEEKTNLINIISKGEVSGIDIEYCIDLKDTNNIYQKDKFFPEEGYQYLGSSFEVDDILIRVPKRRMEGTNNANTEPSIIWYDKDFGIALKYYVFEGREIFLLNGISLYCNGNHCNDCQMFVLQRISNKLTIDVVFYNENSHNRFDEIDLFDENNDKNPEFYLLNEEGDIFIKYSIGKKGVLAQYI